VGAIYCVKPSALPTSVKKAVQSEPAISACCYFLSTAELPIVSRILAASRERPYLGLRLNLDPVVVGSVMLELDQLPLRSQAPERAIEVSPLDAALLDAVVRLVALLASPDDMRHLLPLVAREIVYRLLIGEQGHRLRQMAATGGHTHRITETVTWNACGRPQDKLSLHGPCSDPQAPYGCVVGGHQHRDGEQGQRHYYR
jgi:hypothetical protein